MSTISASTTSTTGFKVTSDTTGTLVFQTGASPTTAMTISSSQIISFTNPPTATGAGSVATNTAYGTSALAANTSGSQNTALGYQSLQANTTASNNTSVGYQAGFSSTTATNNVFIGRVTGYTNTTGSANTFVGTATAYYNTTGSQSVSLGSDAYQNNTTGSFNTAIGQASLFSNTTASNNTAVGYQAGYANTTGASNAFIGYQAGTSNTTGSQNSYLGYYAGGAMTTGSSNTIVGRFTGNQGGLDIRTASNNIVLSDGDGNPRFVVNSSGAISFGAANGSTDIAGGAVGLALNANSGLQMLDSRSNDATNTYRYRFYNTNGLVGGILTNGSTTTYSTSSDYRLKENIQPMTGALAKVVALKPCTYTWKADGSAGEGFIAHELAEVCPYAVSGEKDAVEEDGSIKPQAIDTSFLVATLTAAIQELNAKFEAYKATHP